MHILVVEVYGEMHTVCEGVPVLWTICITLQADCYREIFFVNRKVNSEVNERTHCGVIKPTMSTANNPQNFMERREGK